MKLILARGSSHHHNFLYGVPGQGSTLKEERMVDRTANFVEGLGSRIVNKNLYFDCNCDALFQKRRFLLRNSMIHICYCIMVKFQRGNASCVLGTIPHSEGLDEIFEFVTFGDDSERSVT